MEVGSSKTIYRLSHSTYMQISSQTGYLIYLLVTFGLTTNVETSVAFFVLKTKFI